MVNRVTAASCPVAVVDLGSNSVLLLVLGNDGRVLYDGARITRLGQGVFNSGALAPAAMTRTREVVCAYSERARALGARQVVGVGTEALRLARNGAQFLETLCQEGLLDVAELLTGEEEARLAVEATQGFPQGAGEHPIVMDVGGGSTELAWLDPGGRVRAVSLPIGSVRLTETHLRSDPVSAEEMGALRGAVGQATRNLEVPTGPIVAVAGTATTLAALELRLDPYDPEAVEGYAVTALTLRRWIDRLAGLRLEARRRLPGLEPARADVIVAGLVILEGFLERMGVDHFSVSGRGVRYGVALRLLEGGKLV
jgi:exopolyphosphatase/guanosine-5'-triphosphate,3'-diphosphate pyrophosphatase